MTSNFYRHSSISNHGAISDRLHILDSKSSPKRVKVDSLTKLSSNRTELSRKLKLNRSELYNETISLKKKDGSFRKKIMRIVTSIDLAYDLFSSDLEKVLDWIKTPNTMFFGDSPFEVLVGEEGDMIIEFLLERLGNKPGAGF